MDATIWTALPQAGVAGVLVTVIVYVLRSNHADRQQYAQLRTTTQADHDRNVSELRAEVHELRGALETERRARYKAEDTAARYRRLAGAVEDD